MPKIVAIKEDWVKLGFKLFTQSGRPGINVENMAKTLNCNKSSFYWHFKNKHNFIDEIISFWIKKDTDDIIQEAEKPDNAKDKLRTLIHIVFSEDPYIDFMFHIKKEAQQRPEVAGIVAAVDERRIAYVSNLLAKMGIEQKAALQKSRLFYKYMIGFHEMNRYKKRSSGIIDEIFDDLEIILQIKIKEK